MKRMRTVETALTHCQNGGDAIVVHIPRALKNNETLEIKIFKTGYEDDPLKNYAAIVRCSLTKIPSSDTLITEAEIINDFETDTDIKPAYGLVDYYESPNDISIRITFYFSNGNEYYSDYSLFDGADVHVLCMYR